MMPASRESILTARADLLSTVPHGLRSATAPTCRPTSPAARASTGSMPAPGTAPRRPAVRSPTGWAGPTLRAPTTGDRRTAWSPPTTWRHGARRCWSTAAFGCPPRPPHHDRPGGLRSTVPMPWVPQSKPIRFTELGCPAIDRGTNQPNVFFDPKSSESFTPHFSRSWRDDARPAGRAPPSQWAARGGVLACGPVMRPRRPRSAGCGRRRRCCQGRRSRCPASTPPGRWR